MRKGKFLAALLTTAMIGAMVPAAAYAAPSEPTPATATVSANSVFTDVTKGAYYEDAVTWAVDKKITSGTSKTEFSPAKACTRAQIVTFLWRMAGSPKAEATDAFTDVPADAYYKDAVAWAVEKKITSGTSKTTFSPNDPCTRAQAVTLIYRYVPHEDVASAKSTFSDVSEKAYYTEAVDWAVFKNVTSGTSKTTFSPADSCTRAQIVTFLYRLDKASASVSANALAQGK